MGKITPVQRREVRASDFGPRASFWMIFPKQGSQLTPPHQSEDFKWKDYCPMVFRLLNISHFVSVQQKLVCCPLMLGLLFIVGGSLIFSVLMFHYIYKPENTNVFQEINSVENLFEIKSYTTQSLLKKWMVVVIFFII